MSSSGHQGVYRIISHIYTIHCKPILSALFVLSGLPVFSRAFPLFPISLRIFTNELRMASIRKIAAGKWIAEIRTQGKYLSKVHPTEGAANSWARTEEHRIRGKSDILTGKTFAQAMQRYAKEVTPAKKGARWETIRLLKIERDDIASMQLTDLRSTDIEDWIDRQKALGLKGSSINRELNLLSAVLTKARKRWKWLEGNPMTDVDRPDNPEPRAKTFSDDQISCILLALGYEGEAKIPRHKIAVAFLLALETAMRQGEIFGLTWEKVQWDKCHLHLPETKNGTSRDVPLSKRAIELLKSLNPGTGRIFPMPQASAGVIFRRAVALAGIEGLTFHDARHTATTRLAGKLDMLTLARMTGHKDPRQLLLYYNPTAHDIAKKLD